MQCYQPSRVSLDYPGIGSVIQDPEIAAKIQGKWDMGHIQGSLPWGLVSLGIGLEF